MNYIRIGEENYKDFREVLYPGYVPGENRVTIGAYEDDGTIQGAISVILADDQYDCDWLYVHPDCRRKGIGTGLFDQVMRFIRLTGMVYPLSAAFEVSGEDRELYGFFRAREDMLVDYSHMRYYIQPEQIDAAEALKQIPRTGFRRADYSELDQKEKKKVLKSIGEDHIYLIPDIGKWEERLVPGLNTVLFHEDGNVAGYIFFQKREDKYLELSYIFCDNSMGAMQLLTEAAGKVRKDHPGYGVVYDAVSDDAEELSGKVFPEAAGISVYEANW